MDIKKTYWAIALAIASLWAVFSALLGIVAGPTASTSTIPG